MEAESLSDILNHLEDIVLQKVYLQLRNLEVCFNMLSAIV
jgi:hypothetical protein